LYAQQDSQFFRWIINQHAQVLLYLREIGAEPFVTFVEKPGLCEDHYQEYTEATRIMSAFDKQDLAKLAQRISRSSTFRIEQHLDRWWFSVDGPFFREAVNGFDMGPKRPSQGKIAKQIATNQSFALVTDLLTAGTIGLPLAETIPQSRLTKARRSLEPTASEVALHLDLPVLDRLDLCSFLKFREDERDEFESFRTALAAAISEQLSTKTTAAQAADAVIREFVAPSLSKIEGKAKSGRRAILKKTALDYSIGTSATVVSLTQHIPLLLTGTAAAVAASLDVLHKQIEARESLRLSDCYFLWHAKKVAAKHSSS
jgi:hypothetical protein